jgi:hypothetical protein
MNRCWQRPRPASIATRGSHMRRPTSERVSHGGRVEM